MNSAQRQTPGPWLFGVPMWDEVTRRFRTKELPPEYAGENQSRNPGIYGADGSMVVGCDEYDVFGDASGDPVRRAADIRLMLAAPRLLDVLKDALAAAECTDRFPDYVTGRIRSAIENLDRHHG